MTALWIIQASSSFNMPMSSTVPPAVRYELTLRPHIAHIPPCSTNEPARALSKAVGKLLGDGKAMEFRQRTLDGIERHYNRQGSEDWARCCYGADMEGDKSGN